MLVLAHIVARIEGDAGGHRALAHSSALKIYAENKVIPLKICPTHFVSLGIQPVLLSISQITQLIRARGFTNI